MYRPMIVTVTTTVGNSVSTNTCCVAMSILKLKKGHSPLVHEADEYVRKMFKCVFQEETGTKNPNLYYINTRSYNTHGF